jgi:putative solute:sodium symporter small subunit
MRLNGGRRVTDATNSNSRAAGYWRSNLRVLAILLPIWAVAGFGLGILFVEPLNALRIAGFPLGFWFAQQGAIWIFVTLILVYALWMDRIERQIRREQ